MHRKPFCLLLALVFALSSCSEDPSVPEQSERAHRTKQASSQKGSAPQQEAELSAWPSDVQDFETSIGAFQSIDQCRRSLRERVPTEIAEAVSDVGYHQLLDDVCLALSAAKSRNPAACDRLTVSALRRGCRRRVALYAASPNECPRDPVVPGRDPMCLAWAARDPGLCRAVEVTERTYCRAALTNNGRSCASGGRGVRERCEAAVRRYGKLLSKDHTESSATSAPAEFRLEARVLGSSGESNAPIAIARDILDRGVYLEAQGCNYRVRLEDPMGEVTQPIAFTERPPTATASFEAPSILEPGTALTFGVTGAKLNVVLPGIGSADTTFGARGSLTVLEWTLRRGAPISGRIDAELPLAPGRVRVSGSFKTFVRDLDPLPRHCAH